MSADELPVPMTRREAVKSTSLLVVGVTLGALPLLSGCKDRRPVVDAGGRTLALTHDEQAQMEAIADTLLPDTPASPGARAAGAGPAINLLLSDVYPAADAARVRDGLAAIDQRCRAECGGGFRTWNAWRRTEFLTALDAEAVKEGTAHWWHVMRRVSLDAYYSSETGMTKALRYVRIPGRWTGCVTLEPGQPAWG